MEALTDNEIKRFLENSPLYSWKTFAQPQAPRYDLFIYEIDMFCESCQMIRPFHTPNSTQGLVGLGGGTYSEYLSSGTTSLVYSCVSCRIESHEFLLEHKVTDTIIKIQKYGQLPRRKLERNSTLQKFFKIDAEYYEKALISLNNGYGIAAFAYFRRIIEINISELLDLLQDDLDSTDNSNPLRLALDELRKESPMSDKIKIANNALPDYLKPDGLNPLGKIYSSLSEGVHALSDENCLKNAENLQACISFLITELANRKRNKDAFKSLVGNIN